MVDVYGRSNSDLIVQMKPRGFLGRIQPLLMLPEVLDVRQLSGDRLPFADKEGMAFSMGRNAARLVVYNSNLIREGEITTVRDLLKPQYRGKITLNDPTVTGAGNALFTYLGHNLYRYPLRRDKFSSLPASSLFPLTFWRPSCWRRCRRWHSPWLPEGRRGSRSSL
jgi:hypothetical protein